MAQPFFQHIASCPSRFQEQTKPYSWKPCLQTLPPNKKHILQRKKSKNTKTQKRATNTFLGWVLPTHRFYPTPKRRKNKKQQEKNKKQTGKPQKTKNKRNHFMGLGDLLRANARRRMSWLFTSALGTELRRLRRPFDRGACPSQGAKEAAFC